IARLGNREAELDLPAGPDDSTQIGDVVARAAVIGGNAAGDSGLPDVGVAVGEVEVVDEASELPLKLSALAAPKQVRLIQADETAESGTLPHRCAEVDITRSLFFVVDDDVDVPLVAAGTSRRSGHRCREEVELAYAL